MGLGDFFFSPNETLHPDAMGSIDDDDDDDEFEDEDFDDDDSRYA